VLQITITVAANPEVARRMEANLLKIAEVARWRWREGQA
jgi:hypothetical protein